MEIFMTNLGIFWSARDKLWVHPLNERNTITVTLRLIIWEFNYCIDRFKLTIQLTTAAFLQYPCVRCLKNSLCSRARVFLFVGSAQNIKNSYMHPKQTKKRQRPVRDFFKILVHVTPFWNFLPNWILPDLPLAYLHM